MVSKSEECPNFQAELNDFADLRKLFSELALVHRRKDKNVKTDMLVRNVRLRKAVFSFTNTYVPS